MYDETAQHRQMRRRDALNLAAQTVGYASWSQMETDIVNGRVQIALTPVPVDERTPLVRPSPYTHMPKRRKP